jgi:PKD repeat protein
MWRTTGWLLCMLGMLCITGCETIPPTVPAGLTATADDCSQVTLDWGPATDAGGSGLKGYRVYRDGNVVAEVLAPATDASDSVSASTSYDYEVSAVDHDGNESARSAVVSVTTPPCVGGAPSGSGLSVPKGFNATAIDCGRIDLSWQASIDTSGSGLRGYEVYRNNVLVKQVTAPAVTAPDTGLSASTRYTYKVRAVNNAGTFSAFTSGVRRSTPACVTSGGPPTANAGPDQFTQTLTPVAFDGSGSSVSGRTLVGYAWDFGDGASGSGRTVSHTYTTPGAYTATLTVTDSSGATARDTAAVGVANRPPVANPGPDQNTNPGTAVTLNGSGSSDPDGSITSYAWDFGDGASATGAVVTHTYASAGAKVATLTVTDDRGARGTDAATVTVASTPPPAGTHRWSENFGGPTSNDIASPRGVAVDLGGNVAVTGHFHGGVDFGGGALNSVSSTDLFLARYSGSDGHHLWSKRFGPPSGLIHGSGVATDWTGNILVTGDFLGALDLGGGPLPSPPNVNGFVGKFSASGAPLWSTSFLLQATWDMAHPNAIAVDTSGNVVVTGDFSGTVDFGGGPLSSSGSSDIFVVKYSSTGAYLWSRRFGSTDPDVGRGIAVDPSGNVIITGEYSGAVNFGGGPLPSQASGVVVAELSASGAHLWSRGCGGPGRSLSVAADASGNAIVTGYSYGTLDFGGGPRPNLSGSHASPFAAKLSSSGAHVWSKSFGNSGAQTDDAAYAVAVDGAGNVLLTGYVVDSIDFGGGPLLPISGPDTFVAKLSPQGGHLWSKRFPQSSPSSDAGRAIAVDASGDSVLTGEFFATLDFGGGPLTNAGGASGNASTDAFLVKLGQ